MTTPASNPQRSDTLRPVLGLFSAAALVVGATIGSGVFFKPKEVAQGFLAASSSGEAADSFVPLILLLWVACGLVNLCGALTLAELSTMMPHSGGMYVYLREAYGRLWAFLWGWAEFWVIRSGSTAALAAAMTMILADPLTGVLAQFGYTIPEALRRQFELGFPLAVIALLTLVNIAGTQFGGLVQNITTVIKASFVLFLGALPFLASGAGTIAIPEAQPLEHKTLLAAIGVALGGIMWAYDGWGMVTVVAEEIKDPARNIPRALTFGVVFLTLIYLGANLAYHRTMNVAELAVVDNPAVAVTGQALGSFAEKLMQAMLMISVFGALNSNILVGPRVLFAVARDNPFLGWLKRVDPRFGTPALAIAALSSWTCVLVVVGHYVAHVPDFFGKGEQKRLFDVLTNYTVFGGSLFYFAAVLSVYVFRVRRPNTPRPYRTWGYPWIPLVFLLFYIFLLVTMFYGSYKECLGGLVFVALGIPVYFIAWMLVRFFAAKGE